MRLKPYHKLELLVDKCIAICYNKRGASTTDNWGVVDLIKPIALWLGVCNLSKTFQKKIKKNA